MKYGMLKVDDKVICNVCGSELNSFEVEEGHDLGKLPSDLKCSVCNREMMCTDDFNRVYLKVKENINLIGDTEDTDYRNFIAECADVGVTLLNNCIKHNV